MRLQHQAFVALAWTGPIYEALVAAAAGAVWVAVLLFRPKTPVHGLFLFLGLAGTGIAAVRGQVLLGLAGCTLCLFAWDAVTVQHLFSILPPRGRRKVASRYAAQALLTAAVALAAPAIGVLVHPAIGFPVALGLCLAALSLLGVALWQGARVGRRASDETAEPDAAEEGIEGAGKEEAGKPLRARPHTSTRWAGRLVYGIASSPHTGAANRTPPTYPLISPDSVLICDP